MTRMSTFALAGAAILVVTAVSVGTEMVEDSNPPQQFWQLHGVGPVGLHELGGLPEMRNAAREALAPATLVASR